MIPDFSQVAYATIFTENISEAIQFYNKTLGMQIKYQTNNFVMLGTHPITVNIHEAKLSKNQDFDSTQIAFYVHDVERAFQYLKS